MTYSKGGTCSSVVGMVGLGGSEVVADVVLQLLLPPLPGFPLFGEVHWATSVASVSGSTCVCVCVRDHNGVRDTLALSHVTTITLCRKQSGPHGVFLG